MPTEVIAALGRMLTAMGWAFLPVLLLPLLQLILPRFTLLRGINHALIRLIDTVSYRLGEIAKWFLLIMVMATIISVIGLSIFGISYTKLDELPIFFHACLIMLGSAATLLAGQHVRVDIFHSQYTAQKRALLDLIGFYALIIPICLILIWVSQIFVYQSWLTLEGSPESDGIRGVFFLKTLLPTFALLMLAQGLSITARAVFCLQELPPPPRPSNIAPLFEDQHFENQRDGPPKRQQPDTNQKQSANKKQSAS